MKNGGHIFSVCAAEDEGADLLITLPNGAPRLVRTQGQRDEVLGALALIQLPDAPT